MKTKVTLLILFMITASALSVRKMRLTLASHLLNRQQHTKAYVDKVPGVYAITGSFDRIVILRLKYKTDLLTGMEKIVKQEHIRNGVILAALGSVRGYQIHQVSNRTFPSQNTHEKNPTTPADLVGMNGYIIGGRIHAHVTLATPEKTIAGHLEPGTQVFTFAVVTIGVMNEANFSRIDDKTYR